MKELKHCFQCNSYKQDRFNYCEICGEVLVWYLPEKLEVWIENHDNSEIGTKQNWYYPNWTSVKFFVNPRILSGELTYSRLPVKGRITDAALIKEMLEIWTANDLTFIEGPIEECS